MNRAIKGQQGVISVFVALMMAGILSLGTFVLEAGRFQAAKTQLSESTISASSSMLAAYNPELYARFGLLAIDENQSNNASCREYVDFNSDLSMGYLGNNLTRMYSIESVNMKGLYNLTYPSMLKRQLLTIAKYNIVPENSNLNMYTVSYILNELQNKCLYVAEQMELIQNATLSGDISGISEELKGALHALDKVYANKKTYNEKQSVTLSSDSVSILPSQTRTIESDVPEEDAASVNAVLNDATTVLGGEAGVLNSVSNTTTEVDVNLNLVLCRNLDSFHSLSALELVSPNNGGDVESYKNIVVGDFKNLSEGINAAIDILRSDSDGHLLLNSYISQCFSNRHLQIAEYSGPGRETTTSNTANMTFAAACAEYIFGGDSSETHNQSEAYDYLSAIRLIGNLYSVLKESESFDSANLYSVVAHLAWAYYETCVDMELLTFYDAQVPLSKDKLILSINNPGAVASTFASGSSVDALRTLGYYNDETGKFAISGVDQFAYTDSLAFSLWFVPNSEKMFRVADLIQLEMRYLEQYVENVSATFLMSEQNTYCRVKCEAKMNSILPIISLGTGHNLDGLSFQTMKYAGY